MSTLARTFAAFLALGVGAASCSYQATSVDAAATATPLFDATEQTPDGTPYDLAALAGQPLVVFVWAPWCGACRRMAPTVADLPNVYPDISFLSVSGRSHVREVERFIDEHRLGTVDQVYDNDLTLASTYAIIEEPGWLFIDRTGNVEVQSGELTVAELNDHITAVQTS